MVSVVKNKKRMRAKAKYMLWYIVRAVIIVGICYVILYPFLTKIINGFKSYDDLIDPTVEYFPRNPTLQYYIQVLKEMDYLKSFGNTLLISLVVAFLQTAVAAVVGYGFARFKFKGNKLLFAMVILMLIIPPQIILVPLFVRFKMFLGFINLIDTPWPTFIMAATGTGFKNGLYIFLTRQFFINMPKELNEAAAIDGCGVYKTFFKIMLPSATTILTTVFLLSFSWQWTDTLYNGLFFQDTNILSNAINKVGVGAPMAVSGNLQNIGALWVILPLAILYIFAQRAFVESIDNAGIVG